MNSLTIIFGILFTVLYFFFAYYTRKTKTFEDFSVGNRNIGFLLLFMSISATYIGPGFTMGLTSQGYSTGFFYFFMVLGYALQILLVGLFIAPKLRAKFTKNTYSIGDIIGGTLTHNNVGLKLFSGLISFGLILGFSIVMCSAAVSLLSYFFGFSPIFSILIFTSITALYSFTGGMRASIYTDVLQFGVFATILPALLVFIFIKQDISFLQISEKISQMTTVGFEQSSLLVMIGLILSFTLGELLLPPLVGRILASKSPSISKKSFIVSAGFLVFWLLIMFLIGVLGSFAIDSPASDTILLELGKTFLPQGLYGIFIVAMIGVIMSSLDSLINYGSTLFTRDIAGIITPSLLTDDTKQLFISRIITVFIAIFSGFFAISSPSVLEGLLLCYTLWVPTILVVLLRSIYSKKLSIIGAYLSMILGLLTSLVWQFSSLHEIFPTIIAGLIFSIFGYLLGYMLDKRTPRRV